MGIGKIRPEEQGLLIGMDRFVHLSLIHESQPQGVVRIGVLRTDLQSLLIMVNRLGHAPELAQSRSQIEVRHSIVGFYL